MSAELNAVPPTGMEIHKVLVGDPATVGVFNLIASVGPDDAEDDVHVSLTFPEGPRDLVLAALGIIAATIDGIAVGGTTVSDARDTREESDRG